MKFGVLGKSLPHTYSPQIHKAFADYEYSVLERTEEEVHALFDGAEGLNGFNVTIPYKKLAASLCTELSEEAKELGAADRAVYWYAMAGLTTKKQENTEKAEAAKE